jgi:hypothetical protein
MDGFEFGYFYEAGDRCMTNQRANARQPHNSHKRGEQSPSHSDMPAPNLADLNDVSQVSAEQVLYLQRTIGNAQTARLLGNSVQPLRRTSALVRREPSKLGGGVSLTGVKVNREKVFYKSPERNFGYVSAQLEVGGAAEIEVKWDEAIKKATGKSAPGDIGVEGKGNDSSSEGQLKIKAELWKSKTAETNQEKTDILASLHDHIEVSKAELEFIAPKAGSETKTDEATGKNTDTTKSSMGVALVISTAAGDKHKLFLNVFESKVTGEETVVKGPHGGLEFSVNLLPKCWSTIASELGVSIAGSLIGKAKVTFSPNYATIAAEAAKRYGAPLLARLIGGSGAGIGMIGSGLIGGAVMTIQGYYQFMQQMGELRELKKSSDPAVIGYATGFMQGIGATGFSGGDAGWSGYGIQRGQAALASQLQAMRKRLNEMAPDQAKEITDDMIRDALKERIVEGSQQLYGDLYGAVATPIKVLLYRKFMETHPDEKEYVVRGFAGLAPYGELPDPFKQTAPEEPAGGGAAAAGDSGSGGAASEEYDTSIYDDAPQQQAAAAPAKPAAKPTKKVAVPRQDLEHEEQNRQDQSARDKAQENADSEQAQEDYNNQATLAAQSQYWADDYQGQ